MRLLTSIRYLVKSRALGSRGDTIVEVLLSVTILGLVLAVSFTSAGRSLNAGTDAANRNQALNFAQEQIELLHDAANTGKLSSYPTDGSAFCINPLDSSKVSVSSDNYCHLSGQDPFGVAIKYNSANQTFNITASWPSARATDQAALYYQVPVNPIAAAPNVGINIVATPSVVPYRGSTTISWSTTTALSCKASGAWSGNQATSGTQTFNNLTTTGTYSLTCQSVDGVSSLTRSVKVYVSQLPPPVVNFTATPTSVTTGGSSTLSWSTDNAVSCSASGAWSGAKTLSGSQSTGALSTSQTYTLTCINADGVTSTSVDRTVTVYSIPTASLSASPGSISYGASSTLSWSSADASSCTASGAWSGSKSTSGTVSTGALYSTTTYYLTCSGPGGTSPSSSTTVYVSPPPAPPGVVFCQDDNYRGTCWGPYPNDCSWVEDCGVPNDVISSIYFSGSYNRNTRIWIDWHYGGACRNISGNTSSLDGGWNDMISSWATGGYC